MIYMQNHTYVRLKLRGEGECIPWDLECLLQDLVLNWNKKQERNIEKAKK